MRDNALQPIIRFSSTDMTLALGAELFVREHHDTARYAAADPAGEQCFITLVDLIVNSEACFLTLPAAADYGSNPLVVERLRKELKRIPECAAVTLSRETEDRVFTGFRALITDNFAREWLGRWLRSQFLNPIVNAQHHARLGERARNFIAITDEGRAIWEARAETIDPSVREQLTPLLPMSSALYDADIERAGGLANFQYSYAFDVYRRGWQYADKSRQSGLDLKYFPHALRQAALDNGSPEWLEFTRDHYWSWGRCLAHLIRTLHPEPEQVIDWILAIMHADPPKWMKLPPADEDTDASRREKRALIEQIESAANTAGLPLSQLIPLGIWLRAAEIPTEHVRERLELGTICKILECLGAAKVVHNVGFGLGESMKQAINIYYQKGTFGYPGLVGSRFESRAGARSTSAYLL